MDEPLMGSRVRVWPLAGLAVATGGGTRSFLPATGEDVTWDEWWHRRFRDGSVHLHDPNLAPVPAKAKASKPLPASAPEPATKE